MHRKQGAELFPLDTEIERTLRGLRKVKSAEIEEMVDERLIGQSTRNLQQKYLKSETLWRTSGDQSSKMNTQQ